MDNTQRLVVYVTLALMIGAAASESFLHVTWSVGLYALMGVPIGGIFAAKTFESLKSRLEAPAQKQDEGDKK